MEKYNTRQLRLSISEYAKPANGKALLIFFADICLYTALLAGVIFIENITLRIICSILAGLKIASLFVIGHDAAHGAYTSSKLANEIIARVAFLPSLHNYSLWVVEHNRNHHQANNVKGLNSWSPLSKAEYDALPVWRQSLEKIYRSPAGIALYYMIERWWKNKFFPMGNKKERAGKAMLDFIFLITGLMGYISLLIFAGNNMVHTTPMELVMLACIVPFLVWNFMMGFTVYQQHTHETIPWTLNKKIRQQTGSDEDFTMHVKYPAWFNLVSHNIMEHTAHHVDPRVPLYNLGKAQLRLSILLGENMNVVKFSPWSFLNTMAICKLYDFDKNQWLDFSGNPSSLILANTEVRVQLPKAA